MRISERDLRRIIREAFLLEGLNPCKTTPENPIEDAAEADEKEEEVMEEAMDGSPYDGSLESLAKLHSKPWGHGSVVDEKGWADSIKRGRQFTKGTASGPLKTSQRRLSEKRKQR